MKTKLLRRFRKRYHVGRSSRPGYPFAILDHGSKRVDFMPGSYEVANFCAAKMLGMASALSHESRYYKRQHTNQYYRYATGGKG